MKIFVHLRLSGLFTLGIGGLVLALSTAPAARAGISEAQAAFKAGKYDTARKELQPLMRKKRKPAAAHRMLARIYLEGLGVAVNYSLAYQNLLALALKKNSWAQTELGKLYAAGNGPPQSYAKAASYYKQAADNNYGPAQSAYADAHMSGQGMRKDPAKAYVWYNLAAVNLKNPARKEVILKRDKAAEQLSAHQLAAAQERALELSDLMKDALPPEIALARKAAEELKKKLKDSVIGALIPDSADKAIDNATKELEKAIKETAPEIKKAAEGVARELDKAAAKELGKAKQPAKSE